MRRLRNPTATTRDGRAVYATFDGKFFFSEAKAVAHENKKNNKVIAEVEREAFEQDVRGLKPAGRKSKASFGTLDDTDEVLAEGDVYLRVVLYGTVASYKGITPPAGRDTGMKFVMSPCASPTHKQAADWAYWASQKYNRGTTHISPETYNVFTYRDPFFGRNITVIDIGMGS